MNESTLKKVSLWFDIGIGIVFTGFTIFIFVMISINSNSNKILGYGFVILFSFISYLYLTTAIYRRKYFKISDGISVNIEDKELIIAKKNTIQIINNADVKTVELYYSWNTHPFSSDLGYSKIILNDNSNVFLVSNTINQLEIRTLFKNKVNFEVSKFMNKLK